MDKCLSKEAAGCGGERNAEPGAHPTSNGVLNDVLAQVTLTFASLADIPSADLFLSADGKTELCHISGPSLKAGYVVTGQLDVANPDAIKLWARVRALMKSDVIDLTFTSLNSAQVLLSRPDRHPRPQLASSYHGRPG